MWRVRCRQMFRVPFVTGSQEGFIPGALVHVSSVRIWWNRLILVFVWFRWDKMEQDGTRCDKDGQLRQFESRRTHRRPSYRRQHRCQRGRNNGQHRRHRSAGKREANNKLGKVWESANSCQVLFFVSEIMSPVLHHHISSISLSNVLKLSWNTLKVERNVATDPWGLEQRGVDHMIWVKEVKDDSWIPVPIV